MIETKSVFKNYQYVVLFDENFGYRCGYAGIPKGHKLYKKHYSDEVANDLGLSTREYNYWDDLYYKKNSWFNQMGKEVC